ncbi:unnamed protein product [Heterobilharzia americana]|nr:unnamed protein product [Heterobilharzia americana]
MNSKISKSKKPYYGGDKVDADDEESQKLCITDCRQKQGALYSPFLFKSPSSQFLLIAPDSNELFVMSGESRTHLYLRQNTDKFLCSFGNCGNSSQPGIENPTEVDIVVCGLSNVSIPPFPQTLSSELSLFLSHGLPLLVWPKSFDKIFIQKYLDDNYPDCSHWFRELDKVIGWLEQKWRPLTRNFCVSGSDSTGDDIVFEKNVFIRGLPSNCVAVLYLKKRSIQYERYASLLQSYFTHRLQYTPAFHHNPIHHELEEHHKERLNCLAEDVGFFNIVGNRLIQFINKVSSSGKPITLNPNTFTSSIKDPNLREQCLKALLPVNELKNIRQKMKHATNDFNTMGDHSDDKSQSDDDDDDSVTDDSRLLPNKKNTTEPDTANQLSNILPNRPINKEMMKNKGIVKYRHKRERNPRVHLRHKFRKATIRYRSRVAPVRKEEKPYAGELKGIRVNLIKSHKFKQY